MPPRDIGVATASATFFRQMGGTLGVAVFLSILFSTVGNNITHAYRTAGATAAFRATAADPAVTSAPGNKPLLALLDGHKLPSGNLNDTSFLKHADRRLAHPFFVGFSNSMDLIFLLASAVMVVGFLVLLAVRELPLRTMSGIQAQHADAKAERDRQQAATDGAPTAADEAQPLADETAPT